MSAGSGSRTSLKGIQKINTRLLGKKTLHLAGCEKFAEIKASVKNERLMTTVMK